MQGGPPVPRDPSAGPPQAPGAPQRPNSGWKKNTPLSFMNFHQTLQMG